MNQHKKGLRRGRLKLVVIATASGLAACSEAPAPEPMSRAQYDSFESCVEDWGSDQDCEPQLASADAAPSSPGQSAAAHGGGMHYHWWGPYYSRAGTIYHYDGRESRLLRQPVHARQVMTQNLTPQQVYATAGRYTKTPTHTHAGAAKSQATGRGGFGGTGRGASGGG